MPGFWWITLGAKGTMRPASSFQGMVTAIRLGTFNAVLSSLFVLRGDISEASLIHARKNIISMVVHHTYAAAAIAGVDAPFPAIDRYNSSYFRIIDSSEY